jgi:phosphopantothenoylcysteine decarboxylase / phosphopantothenate---cysteine ligase
VINFSFIWHSVFFSSFIIHPSRMSRILITSGPTRQYLDPVRYLTNASSGRMGAALAAAAIEAGHQVLIVSGPVEVLYPEKAELVSVISTEDMLEACLKIFPACNGLIAAAAPCDYRPVTVASHKIRKTGDSLNLQLVETPDVVARLGAAKNTQWMVAFALETEDPRIRAMQKLERKKCDLIVVNGPEAVYAMDTRVEVFDASGDVVAAFAGSKQDVSRRIFRVIEERLMQNRV